MPVVLIETDELTELIKKAVSSQLGSIKNSIEELGLLLNGDEEINPAQVYKKYGCSLYSQKEWRDKGLLPFERRGIKKVVYKKSELEKFFKAHEQFKRK